jgi:chemotaxis protein CheZ
LGKIRAELSDLAHYVDDARKGIDGLEATVKLSSEKFPEASGQLSAVTGDLEEAANNIMTLLEALIEDEDEAYGLLKELKEHIKVLPEAKAGEAEAAIAGLENINQRMKSSTMDIFANTAFADLSGQKLKKVVGALSVVEAKIIEFACSFGFKGVNDAKKAIKASGDGETTFDQSEIDRILKELKQGGA